MSAEAYAEDRFKAACIDLDFMDRLANLGAEPDDAVVVADSTPTGETLANVTAGSVLAVLDEDAPHGFVLVRVERTDR
jgi:hypothetical protein